MKSSKNKDSKKKSKYTVRVLNKSDLHSDSHDNTKCGDKKCKKHVSL
jgi:hypothetical protein